MYKRVFIANRTDCAVRLIRAVHSFSANAVLAVARDERQKLAESLADDVIVTGSGRDAYMHVQNLIAAAKQRCCEAVLPGWGFLSEDASFAQQCRMAGLHFVGPSTAHLALFGDKLATLNTLCHLLGLPNEAIACDDADLRDKMRKQGDRAWALKRRTGGGGKGVFLCNSCDEALAVLEKQAAVGSVRDYYVEPRISGRHIEFQVMGDGCGRVRVLGVRDCSAQVRCQKVTEFHVPFGAEAWLRPFADRIERAFTQLAYKSWGTVETLVEPDGTVHLLEVNPRLQVEHGVTEMAVGIDLVRAALMIECGESFDKALEPVEDVDPERVHVVEHRVYANATGPVDLPAWDGYAWPHSPREDDPDFRLETGYLPGDAISGVFDGMVARLIERTR